MADDRNNTGGQDRSRISLTERYEMDYWKNKFGVSSQRLSGAVRAVGNNPEEVERYLKEKGNRQED
ncbi:MAG: DUF3606 domain-containing protein [Flavobacterium psychrophilum]|nr:MAG: DUF3606 domain-containing protein [Flavobacterium psychrophilum]